MRYLQVALGGEGPAADGADEGLHPGVRALVDLQGAGRGEVLPAGVAVVLLGRAAGGRGPQQAGHSRAADGRIGWREEEAERRVMVTLHWVAVSVHLRFDWA